MRRAGRLGLHGLGRSERRVPRPTRAPAAVDHYVPPRLDHGAWPSKEGTILGLPHDPRAAGVGSGPKRSWQATWSHTDGVATAILARGGCQLRRRARGVARLTIATPARMQGSIASVGCRVTIMRPSSRSCRMGTGSHLRLVPERFRAARGNESRCSARTLSGRTSISSGSSETSDPRGDVRCGAARNRPWIMGEQGLVPSLRAMWALVLHEGGRGREAQEATVRRPWPRGEVSLPCRQISAPNMTRRSARSASN